MRQRKFGSVLLVSLFLVFPLEILINISCILFRDLSYIHYTFLSKSVLPDRLEWQKASSVQKTNSVISVPFVTLEGHNLCFWFPKCLFPPSTGYLNINRLIYFGIIIHYKKGKTFRIFELFTCFILTDPNGLLYMLFQNQRMFAMKTLIKLHCWKIVIIKIQRKLCA